MGIKSLVAVVLAAVNMAAQAQGLVLGVTEGVTYRATDPEIASRFEGIAAELAKATRQTVTVKVISGYNDMRAALKAQSVDIAYIHPAHVALEAVKAQRYRTQEKNREDAMARLRELIEQVLPDEDVVSMGRRWQLGSRIG